MTRFIKPAFLAITAAGLALCATTYGRTIASSPSANAAPLAAPFLLCAGSALAGFAIAGSAAIDAAARRD